MNNLQTATLSLIATCQDIVGEEATIQLFETLQKLILEKPGYAKKLADPKVQTALLDMEKKRKGKKFSMGDAMAAWGQLKVIFADTD